VEEYRFAKALKGPAGRPRQYRFDFAWPQLRIAAEVDGGRFLVRRGKDGRPVPVGYHGSEADYGKLNSAALLGWRVFRFTPEMIRRGEAEMMLLDALAPAPRADDDDHDAAPEEERPSGET